ncbi:MAG: protein BatD [Pseudomonadales bacterium]|nr:protein BatD [Pseudomonadales bacterium]MBO6595953.1 protein BatD [Pseudomonadales bacterium]MBO6822436.1 protein BatD [Pseudomonadales bacterium]
MTRLLIGSVLIFISLFAGSLAQASLTATVDRNIITDVDLIKLTVRAADRAIEDKIDFSALEQDFEIVSEHMNRNQSLSIVNGQTKRVVYEDYVFTLQPKRMGNLFIPVFRSGNYRSDPITIRVQQQTANQRDQMRQFVFFETSVDTRDTYVQGQIIYSVKLFYTEAIGGDFPQAPSLPDTVVETLENENRFEAIVGGKRYYVLEKRYALFPQRSGELVIPRERFTGTRGRGGIFSQRQRVSAVSDSHTVNVRTIPDAFSGDAWIPAKALGVREAWTEQPPTFRVGEPVNRQLAISAIGLSSTLLPELGEMEINGAKVYADPPTTENRVTEEGITALQVTTVGIVPTQEGELTLPEIRIPWWNTQTNREEVAVIESATYKVLPATGDTATAPTVTVPVSELSAPTVNREPANPYWQWAAIAFGLLWLLTAWQWLLVRRQVRELASAQAAKFERVSFSDPDESQQFAVLKKACTRNRAEDAHRQLFLWAKARYPEVQSNVDLGRRQSSLADEIRTLESHLYADGDSSSWRGDTLLKLVDELRNAKAGKQKNKALEAELNPV